MELKVEQNRVPVYRETVRDTRREHFRADVVVTDALPDVREVLFSHGEFCLWRLDVRDGCAELEGEFAARIVCAPEETGEPVCAAAAVPVRMRFQNAGIERGMRPVLDCEISDLDAALLNSRKLRVQLRMTAALTGYLPDELALTTSLGSGEQGLYVKTESVSVPVIADVTEQVFPAESALVLRAGVPADGRLLCRRSEAVLEETKCTGEGVLLCGKVISEVWYRDAQSGETVEETLETAFTQLVDAEAGALTLTGAETQLHLTSAELRCRNDDAVIDAAYHLVAQTVCSALVQAEIVADAYSTRALLTPVFAEITGTQTRQIVSAETAETEAKPSGVVLLRREHAADLWQTAKTYGSSEAAIRAANPETETPSRWVIVPRVG